MSKKINISDKKEGVKTEKKRRQNTQKVKDAPLYVFLGLAIDDYLKDAECIIDMYRTIIPVLESQDKLRRKELRILKNKLKDYGIHTEPHKESTKIDIFRTIKNLFDILNKIDRGTIIFRNNIIISLVSRYDEFISEVIKIILKNNPDPLFNPDKSLNLKDILELGSIDRIRDKFLEKEVENVLRGSHSSHFDYMEKRLEIPLRQNRNRSAPIDGGGNFF